MGEKKREIEISNNDLVNVEIEDGGKKLLLGKRFNKILTVRKEPKERQRNEMEDEWIVTILIKEETENGEKIEQAKDLIYILLRF